MGRKGDLLRQAKAQRVTYTFTAEQLRQHDDAVRAADRKLMMKRMEEHWKKVGIEEGEKFAKRSNALWSERERRFKTGYQQGDIFAMASAMMSVAITVLVEDFHWAPVRSGHRTRLQRFAERVTEEMNRIGTDENLDIIRYADAVDEKYGVCFNLEDEEDADE